MPYSITKKILILKVSQAVLAVEIIWQDHQLESEKEYFYEAEEIINMKVQLNLAALAMVSWGKPGYLGSQL